jgi:hypothetical protein
MGHKAAPIFMITATFHAFVSRIPGQSGAANGHSAWKVAERRGRGRGDSGRAGAERVMRCAGVAIPAGRGVSG